LPPAPGPKKVNDAGDRSAGAHINAPVISSIGDAAQVKPRVVVLITPGAMMLNVTSAGLTGCRLVVAGAQCRVAHLPRPPDLEDIGVGPAEAWAVGRAERRRRRCGAGRRSDGTSL
jgi:hypothetical protein